MSKEVRTTIQVRVDEEVRDKFYEIAKENAQTPSHLIRLWIDNYINDNEKAND